MDTKQSLSKDSSGFSLAQTMMGMGLASVAILGTMQFMELSIKGNRGTQLGIEFTTLSSMMTQVLMSPDVCYKAFEDQEFKDVATAQPVRLLKPDGTKQDFVSVTTNPYSPNLKIMGLTLKKISKNGQKYLAQLDVLGEKQGSIMGGRHLASTMYVNLETDTNDKIIGCSGGGDYVKRSGDTMVGHLNVPSPVASSHPATKAYVDASSGGGGGTCFETTGACGSGYTEASVQTRRDCLYFAMNNGPGFATISGTLAPRCLSATYGCGYLCSSSTLADQVAYTTRICCKGAATTP